MTLLYNQAAICLIWEDYLGDSRDHKGIDNSG